MFNTLIRNMMNIKEKYKDQDHVVLNLEGHFTLENVEYFTKIINPILNQKKQFFFFNFKGITMLDSSAIGALLKCANSMKNLGITLELYDVNNNIETIMRGAYLHKIFNVTNQQELQERFPKVKL
jgi:anti-anti-sigma factor